MKKFGFMLMAAGVLAGSAFADIRVFHGSPDAPNVDVYVNGVTGSPAITDLAYREATPYVPLPTDNYTFQVTPTGATSPVVIDTPPTAIDGNTRYTIAAGNTLANIEPFVYVDDFVQDDDSALIRFIHLSPNAPAVDVGLQGGSVLFDNTEFGDAADEGYISVPGGTYDLEVNLDSDGSTVLPLPGVEVQNGFVYTVFAVGLVGSNDTPLDAQIVVDAVPEPGSLSLLALAGLGLIRRR